MFCLTITSDFLRGSNPEFHSASAILLCPAVVNLFEFPPKETLMPRLARRRWTARDSVVVALGLGGAGAG